MPESGNDDGAAADLHRAFPSYLSAEAARVVRALPREQHRPSGSFTVALRGEQLEIPCRVYNLEAVFVGCMSPKIERRMINCLYTRHWSGFVREQHLRRLLRVDYDWVVPFVLQLLGEYVVETLEVLLKQRARLLEKQYARFAAENPEFVARTKSRIVSYWHCYYRSAYPRFSEYPGFVVAEAMGWWHPKDVHRLLAR